MVRQLLHEGTRRPRAKGPNQIFLGGFEIPDGQRCGKKECQVRRLVVVACGKRSDEQVKFLEVFAFDKSDRAKVDQGDATVAKQNDVPGVQIAVVEVVLQYLTQKRKAEPLSHQLRIDVILDQP